ncbi:hypothetical protein KIH27_18520 [Mycobacterium sp. M1]|uniref:CopG family transcriptional regulator n=1 Tax=Mycolicibacter acidiphilus TaxID=2835306 RepID=A0ABS5RPR6_9MYCO|nr:hypothetical protein [Mycolicibacter acidiphilus]MBS9535584.1 hypothetical protein [Mycolicibacter acidiphilus]
MAADRFQRSGPHLEQAMTVRVPPGLKDDVRKLLDDHDRELRAFVVASLRALHDQPEAFLAYLKPYWPEPRLRGRPPASPRKASTSRQDGH